MDVTDEKKCVILNEGTFVEAKPKLILGPGTGFGCASISYNKTEGSYNVNPGEGGHTEYAVTNEVELRLRKFAFEWFQKENGEELTRLSTERVTAGPALPLLYEFFQQEAPDLAVVLEAGEGGHVTPEQVLQAALTDKDPLAIKVVEQFVKNLAVIIGDMAITTLCYSGIYICGGVAVAMKDYLLSEDSSFIKIFTNKGRMSKRLSEIPVYIVIDEIGLEGAEQYGYQAITYDYDE